MIQPRVGGGSSLVQKFAYPDCVIVAVGLLGCGCWVVVVVVVEVVEVVEVVDVLWWLWF